MRYLSTNCNFSVQAFLTIPSTFNKALNRNGDLTRLQRCNKSQAGKHGRVTMLRVQKNRLPEDWEKMSGSLSGRFLPVDPRDEKILDVLESSSTRSQSVDQEFGPEGPPSRVYGDSQPGTARKWSKRSEAARKRWADPAYRSKVLAKRAEKRRENAKLSGEEVPIKQKKKVEIGCVDSITMRNDEKAKAINDYARSNQLRSEKISQFHQDRQLWMEKRLSTSRSRLTDEEYIDQKKDIQRKRKEKAIRSARKRRENLLQKTMGKGNGVHKADEDT